MATEKFRELCCGIEKILVDLREEYSYYNQAEGELDALHRYLAEQGVELIDKDSWRDSINETFIGVQDLVVETARKVREEERNKFPSEDTLHAWKTSYEELESLERELHERDLDIPPDWRENRTLVSVIEELVKDKTEDAITGAKKYNQLYLEEYFKSSKWFTALVSMTIVALVAGCVAGYFHAQADHYYRMLP